MLKSNIIIFIFLCFNLGLKAQDNRGFITIDPNSPENKRDQAIISANALKKEGTLSLKLKTNKGENSVSYAQGEIMQVYYMVNEPCYLRLIYRLANGELVLLKDNYFISKEFTNSWQAVPDMFECSSPFGYENLIAFATPSLFNPLVIENLNGYNYIKSDLEAVLNSSRGMKNVQNIASDKAEAQVLILTKK